MKTLLIAVLALGLGAGNLQSQAAPPPPAGGEIRGTVVDAENNAPISSASVSVFNQTDKSLVSGAIVGPDGVFRIEGLRPGTYYLRLTMIGYATENTAPLTITPAAPRVAAGSIRLARSAVEIAAVEATADRSVVIAPDRNSYSVKAIAPAATNASDVLENVPSVQVDADGKVSLRGNENVVIQVNGRPSPIRGAQLAGYLKGMPAGTIERVEVIPNPSAKQDPEGMAGIINIVMKQGVELGTSGGFNASGSTNDRYTIGGNVGHQSGPWMFMGTYGFTTESRETIGLNDRTRLGLSGLPLSFTEQDNSGTNGNTGHNVTLNTDYTLNKRDVLSATANLGTRGQLDESLNLYHELSGDRAVLSEYNLLRDTDNDSKFADMMLSFKRTIVPQKHEISTEVRYYSQADDDFTMLWREPTEGGRTQGETNTVDAAVSSLTGQIDYTRELSKTVKLETGAKSYARFTDRDFLVQKDPDGTSNWVRSDLSNALELDETVHAVYGVVSHTTKKVDYQAGLRAEYATRDFALADTNENFPHNYTSLFPSAIVNYKVNDKSQLKGSYSRRIRRPGSFELNPFPNFFDTQNVFLGNPSLNPEYTDAFEVTYQRSGQLGSLQISPFYRRTSDIIRILINTADTIGGREVTSVSFSNLDKSDSWGADVNTQFKVGQSFNGMANVNVFKQVTDGGSQTAVSSSAIGWMFRLNGTYNVNPATALMVNYFYRAPLNIENGKFGGFSGTQLSVRQKLIGDKLTATARVTDVFKTNKFHVNVGDENVRQLTNREFNSRALHLSVQYNWGKPPRLRQRRQDDQQQGGSPFGG
jgi:ferric enterobactin receptor